MVEIAISIFLLVFYIASYYYADAYIIVPLFADSDPVFFPKMVSAIVVAFSALLLFESVSFYINYKKNKLTHQMRMLVSDHQEDPLWRTLLYVGVLFLYLLGFKFLGFVYTTPMIIILVACLLGMKNILLGAVVAVLFTLALDYASLHFLQIMLPQGSLFSS